MTHECAKVERYYAETEFDDWPPQPPRRTELANATFRSCDLCGMPITAVSDYGFFDFSQHEKEEHEPEWVALCWGCRRPMYYDEIAQPETFHDE